MSLRLRINLLITALMLVFTFAVSAMIVAGTRWQIAEEIDASTRVTVQLLTTVIYGSQFMSAREDQVEILHRFLENLGRVRANEVRLYNALGDLVYASPPSTYKEGRYAPEWFAHLVGPPPTQVMLRIQGGRMVILPDASRSVLDAWDDLTHVLGIAALLFVAINVLVFWLIGRLVKPVRTIVKALAETEEGRFDVRLPAFRLPELTAIGRTFNRMAEALERTGAENRRLALVVKQTSDAMLITDTAGAITFWNPAAQRLLGCSDELRGRPIAQLAPPGRENEIAAHLAAVLRQEAIDHVETQRRRCDGKVLDVSLSAAPLVDPRTGAVVGQILSLRDITEKKRADEAARELRWNRQVMQLIGEHVDKERRALARELHDEVSQCATAIKTIGTTIANRAGEQEVEVRSRALTVVAIAGQLYDLVHGMIRKLRTSAPSGFGLARALEDAVAGWQARHDEIRFELELTGDLEAANEEVSGAVYRIVQESLTNVVRHAGATRVTVSIRRARDEVLGEAMRIVVADDGRGIGATGDAGDGGFGLLGMRERVEALHGRLEIESRPGAGTRVVAMLPFAPAQAGHSEGSWASSPSK